MAAPVLPALTMARALPSRTASAARTREESFLRRTDGAGVLVHGDDLRGGEDLEPARVADLVGGPDEHDRDAELLGGLPGAGHDLAGGVVAAHGVHGDRQPAG